MTPASLVTPPSPRATVRQPVLARQPALPPAEAAAADPIDPYLVADNQRGATLIAMARCEREARCNRVGPDARYVTPEDCLVSLEPDTRDEVDARDCHAGIREVDLEACTKAIQNSACRSALDLDSVGECQKEEICAEVD